jgi:protoporphyrinogen oxidase
MLSITRRELIAHFLGTPLLAACDWGAAAPRTFAGALLGQDHRLGHKLRDGFAPQPQSRRRVPIVVVGAGVAGLSAAWRLERAGVRDFELLELEGEVGGTARSGHNEISRYPWAAHYVPCPLPHARALRSLLVELGVAELNGQGELTYDETALVRAPQERLFVADRWYEGLFPHVAASREDLAQLARFEAEVVRVAAWRDAQAAPAFAVPSANSSRDASMLALDAQSFADWCVAHGITSPRMRFYLEYGTRDDMGTTLEQTSAYAGLHYHAARLDKHGPSEFLTWPEGNGRLVQHMAQRAAERLRLGVAVTRARAADGGKVELTCYEPASGRCELIEADHVVFAMPQAWLARVLQDPPAQVTDAARALQTSAWLVANVSLRRRPSSRGFPECWDNVLYGSRSLGYVVATHQTDSPERARTVWTWYLPHCAADPNKDRSELLALSFDECAQLVVSDLTRAHPDLAQCIERIDVFRWGHAMVRPSPGMFAGPLAAVRQRAQQPLGGMHFAHTELSGLALFEEAQWHGVRAAEEILRARQQLSESLL